MRKKISTWLCMILMCSQGVMASPVVTSSVEDLAKHPVKIPMDEREKGEEEEEDLDKSPNPTPWKGKLVKDTSSKGSFPTVQASSKRANFTAVTLADTQAFPPDSMGCVGPSQYIAVCNGRIRSFSKTGHQDDVLDMTTETFFQDLLGTDWFTSDPRIRYDRKTGYWFIVMLGIAPDISRDIVMLAYTSDSVITSSSEWNFFSFAPSESSDEFGDFPTLGVDDNALYIGQNMFSLTTWEFLNSSAIVIPKSTILANDPTVHYLGDLLDSNTFAGAYTPQGVDNFDASPSEGYFIGVDGAVFGMLRLVRIANPGTSPSIIEQVPISVLSTAYPLNIPHKGNNNGTSGYLDSIDDRLVCAHIRNGSLYTVHNIGTNASGVSSPSINLTATGSRWYELNVQNPASPSIVQIGTLYDSTNSSYRRSFWMPSIMTNGSKSLVVGYSTASSLAYVNAGYALRYSGDKKGTLRKPVLYTSSSTAYNPPFNPGGSGGRRWGDYSYVSLDPTDNMTFWTIQEFCNATNSYGCQVVSIPAPPPAAIVSCTPTSLPRNRDSITLKITGKSSNGSAFYNTPTGFSKGMKISVGDLTVQSFTVVSPKEIRVVVSTKGASAGGKKISVTNPDGQKATAWSLVSVN